MREKTPNCYEGRHTIQSMRQVAHCCVGEAVDNGEATKESLKRATARPRDDRSTATGVPASFLFLARLH